MLTTKSNIAYSITHPYVYWDGMFSIEELLKMEKYFNSLPLEDGKLTNNGTNKVMRDSSTSFIYPNDENTWVFNKLLNVTDFINSQYYNYDLLGFDYLQYTVYNKLGHHYAYHMDMNLGQVTDVIAPRKLSFSIIFSDREDYEGGDFEVLIEDNHSQIVEQKKGRIIAFPSYILHRVTPITKGIRKSLVFWACGPKFR
jgi:PKHD-type hydroxylase